MALKFHVGSAEFKNVKTVADLPHSTNADISFGIAKFDDVDNIIKQRDPTLLETYHSLLKELNIEGDPQKNEALKELLASFNSSRLSEEEKTKTIEKSKLLRLLGGGNQALSAISSLITIITTAKSWI